MLRRAGYGGEQVLCTNFFDVPPQLLERFDFVVSFGVAEHFRPTVDFVRCAARYLRAGGTMITTIPNLRGTLFGFLQRHLARSIYDKHVPLNLAQLVEAHQEAGLAGCGKSRRNTISPKSKH
jgi:cyclopropane fatty-acyl-phospholipid synthase-like methyltransferase